LDLIQLRLILLPFVYGKRIAIIPANLKNKENDDEKFSYMFGRIFCHVFGEKSNVKMEKRGGGGQSMKKRKNQTESFLTANATFSLVFASLCSALR
jgi:hypothetical protein